jgi:hypothetical protein
LLSLLPQGFAKNLAGGDGQVWIVGKVLEAVDDSDFGIEKIAHEEVFRQADAAKGFKGLDALGFSHDQLLWTSKSPQLTE